MSEQGDNEHGDNGHEDHPKGLRERLVDVGVELVAAEGSQALTLREIARRAGVSHGAPRRWFPTHLELLSAIARRGFGELAERAGSAIGDGEEGPRAQLTTLARVYLEFALGNRGMYELMFRHDLLESGHLGLRDTSLPLFGVLVDLVGRARPGTDARTVAASLWANLHGIAQLWCWGSLQLATGADDVTPLMRTALDAHLGPESGR
ncbi:TetR/AcrR family transcriptional regulator [Streptomyces sp. NPDC006393]|uniref:TetR/AcrR family transcriptional regulator n=1 Tax=Streptomyces sp. NPDC006393 TaxID=3156763 RepID=UPI0034048AA9